MLLSIWTNPPVLAAMVAAMASFILALWNFFAGRRSQGEIEILKNELAQKKSENDARREYEFEARKRLYQEYEPLLFQLIESSETAYSRIRSLARTAKEGNLGPDGWLSYFEYYAKSTIYNLFVPLAIYQIMKRKLTLVDLNVDNSITAFYKLAKQAYRTFMDDHKFANCAPKMEYYGDTKEYMAKRESNPALYWKQGLPMGILDKTAEFLIEKTDGKERVISYGEFERKIAKIANDKGEDDLYRTKDIFHLFHPGTRPALWRMLITQAIIYNAILNLRNNSSSGEIEFKLGDDDYTRFKTDFDWQKDGPDTFSDNYNAALEYLKINYNSRK